MEQSIRRKLKAGQCPIFRFHLPFSEANHVFNLFAGGSCLEHLELRRNDEAYLDALGVQRIPDLRRLGALSRRTKNTERSLVRRLRQPVWSRKSAPGRKAPRVIHSENRSLVELGAWSIKRLRRQQVVELHPWITTEELPEPDPKPQRVNRDPLAIARFYQSLLDSGVAETRAELSRYLGVSRARVTQVLKRLAPSAYMGRSKREPRGGM